MKKPSTEFPSGSIDRVSVETKNGQKTFKGGSDISSQWLTKRNSVNQTHQAFYEPKGSTYVTQGGPREGSAGVAKKVGKDLVVPKKGTAKQLPYSPNTKPPIGNISPVRGEALATTRTSRNDGSAY